MQALEGKVAVVTGAASGIGLGMTEAFASRGMKVVMADVEQAALEREAERLTRANFEVDAQLVDVSSFESVAQLADAAEARFGAIHVLCNNAGVSGGSGGPRPIWAQSPKDWTWVMGVNFWGVVNGQRAFLPRMLAHGEEGHVVNTSSILGLTTGPGSIYGVSKHAVARLTEGLFYDLKAAEAKIGVTLLCPGMIATNIITASRNRPGDLSEADAPDPARSAMVAAMDARFKADGMAPREVGEKVVQAMLDDQFYLLTHPDNMEAAKRRFDSITGLTDPSPPRQFL
ncbi:MAG TPA: SDR family NAD(P)-dependent oxidoreductase [Caulobacteraceae bacterium]|jgi:NAD(P)-dependent dehydrogenase (short-subunit alcohol dehydrogenase family)|nr:SDR family NAD(P)-dependent oxidoreductase [Caulobacteraceae bacterium]